MDHCGNETDDGAELRHDGERKNGAQVDSWEYGMMQKDGSREWNGERKEKIPSWTELGRI